MLAVVDACVADEHHHWLYCGGGPCRHLKLTWRVLEMLLLYDKQLFVIVWRLILMISVNQMLSRPDCGPSDAERCSMFSRQSRDVASYHTRVMAFSLYIRAPQLY